MFYLVSGPMYCGEISSRGRRCAAFAILDIMRLQEPFINTVDSGLKNGVAGRGGPGC